MSTNDSDSKSAMHPLKMLLVGLAMGVAFGMVDQYRGWKRRVFGKKEPASEVMEYLPVFVHADIKGLSQSQQDVLLVKAEQYLLDSGVVMAEPDYQGECVSLVLAIDADGNDEKTTLQETMITLAGAAIHLEKANMTASDAEVEAKVFWSREQHKSGWSGTPPPWEDIQSFLDEFIAKWKIRKRKSPG